MEKQHIVTLRLWTLLSLWGLSVACSDRTSTMPCITHCSIASACLFHVDRTWGEEPCSSLWASEASNNCITLWISVVIQTMNESNFFFTWTACLLCSEIRTTENKRRDVEGERGGRMKGGEKNNRTGRMRKDREVWVKVFLHKPYLLIVTGCKSKIHFLK